MSKITRRYKGFKVKTRWKYQDPWTGDVLAWVKAPIMIDPDEPLRSNADGKRIWLGDILYHPLGLSKISATRKKALRVSAILVEAGWLRQSDTEGIEYWTPPLPD